MLIVGRGGGPSPMIVVGPTTSMGTSVYDDIIAHAFEPSGLLTPQTLLPSSAYEPSGLLTPHSRLSLSAYEPSRLLISQSLLSPVPMNPPGCSFLNSSSLSAYELSKMLTPLFHPYSLESILNEIFAHSILGKHPNILRYHAAWTENKFIYIQNEFCVGGNLKDLIIKRKRKEKNFSQEELYAILVHVSKGLRYIHALNLAHLNLKSATVLIQKEKMFPLLDGGSHGNDYAEKLYTYKIGDTGHVTNVENPMLEKGDFRYLPREIQKEDFSQVTKADIFSLALTLYEAATLKPLPENGPVWHSIRDSHLDEIEHCDQHFNDLLKLIALTHHHLSSEIVAWLSAIFKSMWQVRH
uniref:Protein kinase domain-containing protein n=1 Tax=Timema poppense TaxID=170557 RepID=A0A7R9DDK8_TIMPO|nr:unnamed protein product [Timema poppensis]